MTCSAKVGTIRTVMRACGLFLFCNQFCESQPILPRSCRSNLDTRIFLAARIYVQFAVESGADGMTLLPSLRDVRSEYIHIHFPMPAVPSITRGEKRL